VGVLPGLAEPGRRTTVSIIFRADTRADLGIIVGIGQYRDGVPTFPLWIAQPFVYAGGVTLLAGPPKKGKSTLLAQLQHARETSSEFLGGQVVHGATLLLTEESGVAVIRKAEGLERLYVLDRRTAVEAELDWTDVLELVQRWCDARTAEDPMHPPLVIIDTLAIWAGIEDENSASEATKALAAVMILAANTGAAIVVVHHTRKGGGSGGEAIRGSSAMLATPDVAAEMSVVSEGSDDRWLDVQGRVILPERLRLAFDRDTLTYSLVDPDASRDTEVAAWLEHVPADGPGLTTLDLSRLWGKGDPRKRIDQLVASGHLRRTFGPTGPRARGWLHWSVKAGSWGPVERDLDDD